ncbi:conjugative transfer ATPase [Vibrio parahaemolyticus]|uniref:conjugative transfer ATPase n=1 Tax=Vibrio parahaemolyticus TaxID=670 RepID=UPI00111F04DF|nr:conjugative transfer ATPase [Vibrio parahaemolyticus]TOG95098.1 conjugative transfer ATPase [Vibrio parahaemolyticus]
MLSQIKHSVVNFFTEGKALEAPGLDYSVPPSFAANLPWIEISDKGLVQLEDGRSLGLFFDVTPLVTEDKTQAQLDRVIQSLASTLCNPEVVDDEHAFVVQLFARDIESTDTIVDTLWEKAKCQDEFTRVVLDADKRHFELIGRKQGIFSVDNRPWRARQRQVRLAVYRWMPENASPAELKANLNQIKRIRRAFLEPSSFYSQGIVVTPSNGESIHDWLSPFFNPSGIAGETLRYREPRSFIDQDFSERLLRSGIRSDVEHGLWWSDGDKPVGTRVMELDTWGNEHFLAGALFGEVSDEEEDKPNRPHHVLFDELPTGTMMTMTLLPQTKAQARARLQRVREAAVGEEQALEVIREDCNDFNVLVEKHPLWRGQLAFYVQGESIDEIDARTQSLRSIFNSRKLSIRFIKNSDQESPLDSYLRWLPMNYHPERDDKLWYCGWVWLEDMLRLSPLFGRATGTGSDLFHYYNRGGELFGFDPLKDYTSNAHLNLFGPSGSGKSATLVGQCLRLMALHRPRLFIIEAGNSFGLFGQFCERHGLSVNRVQVNAKSHGLMAPFADAKHLVGQAVPHVSDESALDIERLNDNDSPDDETRDILGELEIMARLMITGGEKREIDDYRRADSSMVRDAIKAAAEQCHQTQQQVRPTHVKEALIAFSEDRSRPDARRERARVMGEAMAFFCDGLEGQIFDQEAEHWPEADVTIIDLGLYAKTGYEAQMAAAYISLINRINGIAERDQYSGRDIVTLTDEGHLTASNELLAPYAVKIVKMWRKLRAWFWLATQDLADFPDIARKMLNNAEWWVMLNMTEDELTNLSAFKKLSEAENNLIRSMKSEKHKYKEGVVTGQDGKLMQRFTVVPPALYLALGETDGEAKERRAKLMKMHGIGELDAALMKVDEIEQARRNYQGERL